MYVCGITAYDWCHLGHGRVMVVFDLIARRLRALGYELKYVRNITDIDDKIIRRAAENRESEATLTQRFIAAMHADEQWLGVLPVDEQPQATQYLEQIQRLIKRLIDRGYAYTVPQGDVFFRVLRFSEYGKLSGKHLNELLSGARVEANPDKEDPRDFALWKSADPDTVGWRSPWGWGRPGWHIECSTMAESCLSAQIDIHGGGADLIFPHHENEIAQSEAVHEQLFSRYWLHVGTVRIAEEKMSKSLGNFVTLRDLHAHYHGAVVRYFLLSSHYRSPIPFSETYLQSARQALHRLWGTLEEFPPKREEPVDEEYQQAFAVELNDDFNTPKAFAVLFTLNKLIHTTAETAVRTRLTTTLHRLLGQLGIDPASTKRHDCSLDDALTTLITRREDARRRKDWIEADALRLQIQKLGVAIQDRPDGSTNWKYDHT